MKKKATEFLTRDGKWIAYDACSQKNTYAYNPNIFKYIGSTKKTVFRINGVVNIFNGEYHFFTRKSTKNAPDYELVNYL